ncbi:hypothetical protein [Bdellovibrio sp. HCB209]|uniref:hypothetical protein n=1 Tax=Bdellovibrio sp. HCB209 TaxID=3394354 RepID=UPI0039B4F7E7
MNKYILVFCTLFTTSAFANRNPPQFISLVPPGNNLENENQIEVLCPKGTKDIEKCRKDNLAPKTWKLSVYEKPEAGSVRLGEIHVIGTPGKGMKAEWVEYKKSPVKFDSDSKGTDWGYSCYFEFTVSEVKGDWIQLPKRPFAKPVWINIKKDWPAKGEHDIVPAPSELQVGSIYQVSIGNIVPSKFSGSEVVYRMENANDMNCGDETKEIPSEQLKELKMPVSNLYDKDGHLLAWPAYCRGC